VRRSLSPEWADMADVDPSVAPAARPSLFRVKDLLAPAELIPARAPCAPVASCNLRARRHGDLRRRRAR
jgi:hypothetical protein